MSLSAEPANQTYFINVDLDLYGDTRLDQLAAAMADKVVVLHHDEKAGFLCVEGLDQPKTIDQAVAFYCELVDGLSADARAAWDQCETRVFNVGVQTVSLSPAAAFAISPAAVARAAAINAGIALTVYAPDDGT